MDIVTSENPYGCGVLFNLETLEIFQITKPEVKINERGQNMYLLNEQKISKECRKSILESITKR
jgi:hypothetical protein